MGIALREAWRGEKGNLNLEVEVNVENWNRMRSGTAEIELDLFNFNGLGRWDITLLGEARKE